MVLMSFYLFQISLGSISGLNSARLPTRLPSAHMSTGPAGDGKENLVYVALVGAACIGGGIYVSKHNAAEVTTVDICSVQAVNQVLKWDILAVWDCANICFCKIITGN